MFAIQLDESTDVANLSQLMVFARYMNGPTIEEEFLFCKPLETTTKAEDVMAVVSTFFGDMNINWKNIVGVCSDGAPVMLDTDLRSSLKESTISKAERPIPAYFAKFVKEWMPHQFLLFHTQVRWLARVFELKEEVDTFLKMKCKMDLLIEFNKPEFVSHLAYLADIFEALNELNRKLQGRYTNIISLETTLMPSSPKVNSGEERSWKAIHVLSSIDRCTL
ncbi:Protein ZBED8-like [Oopsacas minuta]|uniref:Protein ZBED8-like n=1 Tax=Oopsacas minuta TaxID=111878 RepID=A0AAV7JVP5_9METZ|nr:Protein ZBED8-like [Oopsacas minuta]